MNITQEINLSEVHTGYPVLFELDCNCADFEHNLNCIDFERLSLFSVLSCADCACAFVCVCACAMFCTTKQVQELSMIGL